MTNIIKKIPIPICGLALGLAALGNLLQSYSEGIRYLCGIISGLLLVLFIFKVILFPKSIKADMENPIMASVFGTFPMAMMLLSVYVKPWLGNTSKYLWLLAILIHVALIIYFSIRFLVKLQLPKVFASYFIVYVGIAAASVTAPAYGMLWLGRAAFFFALASLLALMILVTVRYVKLSTIPDPARPLICIYAAPVSLCIVGYMQSILTKSYGFVIVMYAFSLIFYLFALGKAISYYSLSFYPSFASFTFPFVISALASKQVMVYMTNIDKGIPALKYIVLAQTVIAVIAVLYTFCHYMLFIFRAPKVNKEGAIAPANSTPLP